MAVISTNTSGALAWSQGALTGSYYMYTPGTDFSLCFWLNSGDTTSSRVVMAAIGGGGGDGWAVYANNQQVSYVILNNSTATSLPAGTNILVNGTWVYVVFQWRNADNTGLVWIDGVNQITHTETIGLRSGTILTSLDVGVDPNSGFAWTGRLSMVRMFLGLLSAEEMMVERLSPVPVCKRVPCIADIPLLSNGINPINLGTERSFLKNVPNNNGTAYNFTADPPLIVPPRPAHHFLTQSVEPLPFNLNPLDPSVPAVTSGTGLSPSSLTTAAFSPPQGSLLVALVAGGWSNGSTLSATISDSTGGALTWSNPATATGPASPNGGLATIFYAWVPRAQTNMTVTVTYSGFGASSGGRLMDLLVFDGAAPDQSRGAANTAIYSTGQSGQVTLTPKFPGSMIVGISDDTTSNHLWTPNAFTRSDSVFFDSTDVVTMVAWLSTAPTPSPPATLTVGGIWNGGSTAQNVASNNAAWEVTPLVAGQPVVLLQAITTSNYW